MTTAEGVTVNIRFTVEDGGPVMLDQIWDDVEHALGRWSGGEVPRWLTLDSIEVSE